MQKKLTTPIKNWGLLGLVSTITISSLIIPSPVQAGWLRRNTGFRTPREIRNLDPSRIRFPGGRGDSGSCLGLGETINRYRIVNRTGIQVTYQLNGQTYSLSNVYYRDHKIGSGTGCSYQNPVATVNYTQTINGQMINQTHNLSESGIYVFEKVTPGSGNHRVLVLRQQ